MASSEQGGPGLLHGEFTVSELRGLRLRQIHAINKDDLQEAMRLAGRPRFNNPLKTLSNAHLMGLLDKGSEKATFSINSVSENLVAMTLPVTGNSLPRPRKAKKKAAKKPPAKKATKA